MPCIGCFSVTSLHFFLIPAGKSPSVRRWMRSWENLSKSCSPIVEFLGQFKLGYGGAGVDIGNIHSQRCSSIIASWPVLLPSRGTCIVEVMRGPPSANRSCLDNLFTSPFSAFVNPAVAGGSSVSEKRPQGWGTSRGSFI